MGSGGVTWSEMADSEATACARLTMLRSLHGVIHRQCRDFSMDQEERANFGCLCAIHHLCSNLSASPGPSAMETLESDQHFDLFLSLAVSCRIFNTQSERELS